LKVFSILALVIVLLVTLLPGPVLARAPEAAHVEVDALRLDLGAYVVAGSTLVPLRAISENFGCDVAWQPDGRITVTRGGLLIELKIGSRAGTMNGAGLLLQAAPRYINNLTYLPLRFFAEAFGYQVGWRQADMTATIESPAQPLGIMGHYALSSYRSYTTNGAGLTDIATQWFVPQADGSLLENLPQGAEQVFAMAKERGQGTYLAVFSQDRGVQTEMLASEATRDRQVAEILAAIPRYGYKGVLIDYEGLPAGAKANYEAFIERLTTAASSIGYKVMVAVPGKDTDNSWTSAYDYGALGKMADLLVMAHDYKTVATVPGALAPIDWVTRVIEYARRRVPANRLWLNLNVAGIDWPAGSNGTASDIETLAETAQEQGAAIAYDSFGQAAHFSYTDSAGTQHIVWLENGQSVAAKIELARRYHLAGVGIWRLGIITTEVWQQVKP
jgi:spore germination protein YaaH